MFKIRFFNEVDPSLKPFIRHYWYVNNDENITLSQNLLLPMDHVDLIMNIGTPCIYGEHPNLCKPENIHFHGIREHASKITQWGRLRSFGITYTPWGFYFFTKKPMGQYVDRIVNLRETNAMLCQELSAHIAQFHNPSSFIKQMEKSLMKSVRATEEELDECSIIENFMASDLPHIQTYCERNGLSTRKLERLFSKYIGVSPKRFMNIVRFEECARDIISGNESSLTDISYRNGYYDQPHFVKNFKGYTGYAPRDFQSDKPALKSHFDCDS